MNHIYFKIFIILIYTIHFITFHIILITLHNLGHDLGKIYWNMEYGIWRDFQIVYCEMCALAVK